MRHVPMPLLLLTALLVELGGTRGAEAAPRTHKGVVYAVVASGPDGLQELMLDLTVPATTEPAPLVVWIHGGGWRRGSRANNRLAWLVERGFAVASIDYRLSGEAPWPAQIHDCKAAIRWLRDNAARYGYDASRIGAGGSSAGGHLAALLGTSGGVEALEGKVGKPSRASSRVQAVYDLFGPADLQAMPGARGGRGALAQLFGAPPSTLPDVVRAASPVTHVSAGDPPFLIAHGTTDRLVPLAQSRALHDRLGKAGIASTLRVMEGAGHGGPAFNAAGHRDEIEAFFRTHLVKSAAPSTPSTSAAPKARPASAIAAAAARGPYATDALARTDLHDPKRNKDLRVRITWPVTDKACPVLIWSHGAYGSKDAYGPLVQHWASHGYVVLQATHFDSLRLGRAGNLTGVFRGYADRPADVSFLLDQLGELRKRMRGFEGSLRSDQIGVGGHSFGAHTSQLIGGTTTVGADGVRKSFADPRVKAVLLVSPQGRGGELDAASWKTLTRPALILTGTRDRGRKGHDYMWRLHPYQQAAAGSKHLVVIDGARHSFGGITGNKPNRRTGPAVPEQVAVVRGVGLLFFDAYVRDDAAARGKLAPERLGSGSPAPLRVEQR